MLTPRIALIGIGALLVLMGLAMLVLPGPGIITLLFGIAFIWFGLKAKKN